jgi:hypothetical protein
MVKAIPESICKGLCDGRINQSTPPETSPTSLDNTIPRSPSSSQLIQQTNYHPSQKPHTEVNQVSKYFIPSIKAHLFEIRKLLSSVN